ncbi:MAG: hypothetical protein ACFE9I_09635 [Candidatus Hermodarchaeota archaeon]
MEFKKYINSFLLGVIGSIILILSEFFSWFSDYSLIEIYIITIDVALEDSFLFLFPLLSGIICLVASILIIYKIELKIKSIITMFIGLGFLLTFFIDYISQEIQYLSNAGIGFYLGIVGFLLILFNVLNVLLSNQKVKEGN